MHKPILSCFSGLAASLLLFGCGGGGQSDLVPPSSEPASMEFSLEAPEAPEAPSDGPPAIVEIPASEMVDDEGQPVTALQYVQRAVDYYDRMRPMTDDGVQTPWPPLADLSQLIKFRVLKSLPPAPPGQKFVLDPKTLKVSLASQ